MLELVVNNAEQPAPEAPPSDAELRLLCQGALVRAAKKSPLRAVIVLDLGDATTCVMTAGLSRQEALRLTGVGARDLQHNTEE